MIYLNQSVTGEIINAIKGDFSLLDYESIQKVDSGKDIYVVANPKEYEMLSAKGIATDSIIPYYLFRETTFDNPLSSFKPEQSYDALFLGMSHSQCSIDVGKLEMNCLMMAKPSMDLFCHLKYLEKVYTMIEKPEMIRWVVLEAPYYIFNYDLSLFGNFVYTKLNYFETIGDYHNFIMKPDCYLRIQQFRLFMEHFSQPKPLEQKPSIIKRIALKCGGGTVKTVLKVLINKDAVWRRTYQNTIKENTAIFSELVEFVSNKFSNAEFILLVMPFNPIFRYSHPKECRKMKGQFYDIIGKSNPKVVDDFEYVNNALLFNDHCHMNERGGRIYTEHLNTVLANILD